MTSESSPTFSTMPSRELLIVKDSAAVAEAAAERVRAAALEAVRERGVFRLVLSGGSTPERLYGQLARLADFPWEQTEFYFGDERSVPPDDPQSNAGMAGRALLDRPFIRAESVQRMRGELPAGQAAAEYEKILHDRFPGALWPQFDLVLLGLGTDGHTASLFPHSPALDERVAWVAANWVEKLQTERVTLTFGALNAARRLLFLVAGADKAPALRLVLEVPGPVVDIPSRGIRPSSGSCSFVVDEAAAGELGKER